MPSSYINLRLAYLRKLIIMIMFCREIKSHFCTDGIRYVHLVKYKQKILLKNTIGLHSESCMVFWFLHTRGTVRHPEFHSKRDYIGRRCSILKRQTSQVQSLLLRLFFLPFLRLAGLGLALGRRGSSAAEKEEFWQFR